jgi:hypothetical protein
MRTVRRDVTRSGGDDAPAAGEGMLVPERNPIMAAKEIATLDQSACSLIAFWTSLVLP